MSLFLICLLFNTEFKNTEIFKPLSTDSVGISQEGNVFLLDHDECHILSYDSKGNLVKTFGRKGEGPGEFTFPFSMTLLIDRLYVANLKGIAIFDLDGNFLENVGAGVGQEMLQPTINGWAATKNKFDMATRTVHFEYSIQNANRESQQDLGTCDQTISLDFTSQPPKMKYNPARDQSQILVDQTGAFVVYKSGTDFPIRVFSVAPKVNALYEVNIHDRTPLPFNEIWARKKMEEMKNLQEQSNSGMKMEYEPDFPSTFPIVKSIQIGPDNCLLVLFWSKDPNQSEILAYDWKGNSEPYSISETNLKRIFYIQKEMAYVGGYDVENEDYFVLKIPLDQCAKYIEDHPYSEEAKESRVMFITN